MQQIVDFILELDKLKGVTRQTRPLGLDRQENSAEHSWQIAMLASSMVQYAAAPVNIDHVVMMLLVHDIGEIDTGDTIAYAVGGWTERKAAELESNRVNTTPSRRPAAKRTLNRGCSASGCAREQTRHGATQTWAAKPLDPGPTRFALALQLGPLCTEWYRRLCIE